MKILKIYAAALAQFKANNFSEALKLQAEVKKLNPNWTKNLLLEAYIYREQNFFLQEISALEKFLPQIDFSIEGEQTLSATGYSLLGSAYQKIGNAEKAVKYFTKSAALEENFHQSCVEISNAIFAANDAETFSAEDFQKLYALYQNKISNLKTFPRKIYKHNKIRVGYLSADFREHPVAAWSWNLITALDKNNFEVYCYNSSKTSDWLTEKISAAVDFWRDISDLNDFDAAKQIRTDEIDILFDLSGHTKENRLLVAAYRPATIQISGIGYMNSTGLSCFDYFLTDAICLGNWQKYFVEKPLQLPQSHFCYTPIKIFPEPADSPCLKNNFVTFGCFNNYNKINNTMLAAWKKILDAVPNSKLILKCEIFGNAEGKNLFINRLQKLDFDLERLEMRGHTSNYLAEYADIDIALDTFPYAGGATTCEAIYCGVPVVSLYGERHGSRFGLSILKNIGVEELAAPTLQDYISRAEQLAEDFELLNILHKNLRRMMTNSALMDAENYIRAIEENFKRVMEELNAK